MKTKVQEFEQAVKALQWNYTQELMARVRRDAEAGYEVVDIYDYEEEVDQYVKFIAEFNKLELEVQHYILTGQGGTNLQDYFEWAYWTVVKYVQNMWK